MEPIQGKVDFKLSSIPVAYGQELFEKEDAALRGQELSIDFLLPDGKNFVFKAPVGCNVEMLKCVLEKELALPYNHLVLSFNGKVMLDPLSLNDIIPETLKDISVKVELKQ